jgi:hypothetical protein
MDYLIAIAPDVTGSLRRKAKTAVIILNYLDDRVLKFLRSSSAGMEEVSSFDVTAPHVILRSGATRDRSPARQFLSSKLVKKLDAEARDAETQRRKRKPRGIKQFKSFVSLRLSVLCVSASRF